VIFAALPCPVRPRREGQGRLCSPRIRWNEGECVAENESIGRRDRTRGENRLSDQAISLASLEAKTIPCQLRMGHITSAA